MPSTRRVAACVAVIATWIFVTATSFGFVFPWLYAQETILALPAMLISAAVLAVSGYVLLRTTIDIFKGE